MVIVGVLGLAIGGTLLAYSVVRTRLFDPPPDVVITEFLASNRNGLADEDSLSEDWIEIYNRGSSSVDLAGAKM